MSIISSSHENWNVYILRCGDGSLYTNMTTDMNRLLEELRNHWMENLRDKNHLCDLD